MYAPTGMLRGAFSRLSLRKKLTILVGVGVVLPLLVLTYLQYRSLADLQDKTKGAFKDGVRQRLTFLEQRMRNRLTDIATQTLEPIGAIQLSSTQGPEEIEKYFATVKRSHPEIEDIFVFDHNAKEATSPVQSHIVSLFERSLLAQNFLDGNRKYLFAHQPCPTCPPRMQDGKYIFYPLQDSTKGGQSFAGVLLKDKYVSDELVAKNVIEIAGTAHTGNSPFAMVVTISDQNGRVFYTNGTTPNGYQVDTNMDRPFSNWRAQIGLKNSKLDDLARNGFLHSAGATVLVVLVLLIGIGLTLRATDREARLAQAKSNFVSNVSHELKTPLSLISLFSEILELGRVKNEEKRLEYYQIMRHESRRLNKTIDNILDFSKIEAGRKTYNLAEGDIGEVIENVLASYRYQVLNSGFNIKTNIEPNLPTVVIDREAMAQAVSNLVDNAIKYSRDVKQLSITTERRGSNLSIEIVDQGIGIPRAEQSKIFEKFYRVGNGLVHDVKGSGLGLSLVKHIIEAHHGTIAVESEVGKGSRFTILLPLPQSAGDPEERRRS